MTTPRNERSLVAIRFHPSDLAVVERARAIMTDSSLGAFVRTSAVTFARAIIEASESSGIERTTWDACWIADTTLEPTPGSHNGN